MKLLIGFVVLVALTIRSSDAQSRSQYDSALRRLQETTSAARMNCKWEGTAPFCAGACASGYLKLLGNAYGDGNICVSGEKTYCCQTSSIPAEYLPAMRQIDAKNG